MRVHIRALTASLELLQAQPSQQLHTQLYTGAGWTAYMAVGFRSTVWLGSVCEQDCL